MQVQPRMNGAGHGRCLQQLAAMALRTVPGEDDHLTRTAADSLACDLQCDLGVLSRLAHFDDERERAIDESGETEHRRASDDLGVRARGP